MPGSAPRSAGHLWRVLLLFALVLAAYLANGRCIGSGDTLPARYLPISVLRQGNFDLDEFPVLHDGAARQVYPLLDGVPYFLRYRAGHYLSAYSPGAPVLALPVYALPVLAGMGPTSPLLPHLEKLAAALITALSVVVLFMAAAKLTDARWAAIVAVICALGTSSLSISSQALWQHGPGQLFLSLFLYCAITGDGAERRLALGGLALGAAAAVRATNALVGLPFAAALLVRRPRAGIRFALLAALPPALHAAYNLVHFQALDPGLGTVTVPPLAFFSQTPLLEGLAGVLVSPSRGLFVYSPILIFSLVGMALAWRDGGWILRALMAGPFLVVLVSSKWFMWWGGHTYGPRILADVVPVLCFFLVPVRGLVMSSRLARGGFIGLAAVSIAIHALGAFLYDARWDGRVDVDRRPAAVWSWRDGQIAHYASDAARLAGALLAPAAGPGTATSATAPGSLAARFEGSRVDPVVFAGGSAALEVSVTNTGRAVWLAQAPADRGTVRLGWRFERAGVEAGSGRVDLRANVEPGASALFAGRIPVPVHAGEYRLVVEPVSEGVVWFGQNGTAPLAVPVHVLPADPPEVIRAQSRARSDRIAVAVAADRAQYRRMDPVRLRIELGNGERAAPLDVYAILRGPGDLIFLDGHRAVPAEGGRWVPWVRGLPLPSRVTTVLATAPGALRPGPYTAYAILTEPGTYAVVAAATTRFSVEDGRAP